MGTADRSNAPWFALPEESAGELTPAPLKRLAVVGAGQMGSGIAEVAARAGLEVSVLEADDEAAARGRERVARSLSRAVGAGRLAEDGAQDALGRITFTSDWAALDGAEAAIEAVVEDVREKQRVFELLDRHLPDARFLASNTSSVPIMKLARATSRPGRVLGLHFFNPVAVMDLVEVIPSLVTASGAIGAAERFAGDILGKRVIHAPDRAGFVVNALLIPYLLCAIRMLEQGGTSREAVDAGMVHGCHHPMGPLALADLIGLDTVLAVSESLYEEFHEPFYSAPPLLRRMVEGGQLGRKAGRGFYAYPAEHAPPAVAA